MYLHGLMNHNMLLYHKKYMYLHMYMYFVQSCTCYCTLHVHVHVHYINVFLPGIGLNKFATSINNFAGGL